ncbi:urease accessory protein UreE [Bartonella sp. HY329]|uniref:urease accessory protein UreE n=1 Tax=unclassified Bartonella TaxID=2645622 RepID=UPI0021C65E43|nr:MULTISPECIES: urease accessory protein UreE [unclassified Bartonella]UXM95802.1 urease accessory protein UreE [Bartonella sp. HY329]UXN10127.1 urease accessory protein UreE [Bartonella sp. HY328]
MAYKTYRSTKIAQQGDVDSLNISGELNLDHEERHLRRKLLHFDNGDMIMVDLKESVQLHDGSLLQAESGEFFRICAKSEPLYEARAKNPLHLLQLAWHLGNRHLSVEIFKDRITLLRDHVIRAMLEGLGATVREIEAPFQPLHGAYHEHSGGHGSRHHH